jgi:Tol biopolymer transport system component
MTRKMKKIIVLFALTTTLTAYSQKDTTSNFIDKSAALLQIEQGKNLLLENNYLKAIITFRNAANKDPYSWRAPFWLAKTHYKLNNYGYSLKYANEALTKDSTGIDKEINYYLAQSYHRLNKLDSAVYYYEKCIKTFNKKDIITLDIQNRYNQALYAQKVEKQEKFAAKKVVPGDVNTGHNDYGPVLASDGKSLYFTSRRNNTTGGGQNPYDEVFYEDIYHAQWDAENETWDSITNVGLLKKVNGNGFESLSWLSPDGTTAYITINNEAVDEKITTRSSDIFEINLTSKGAWSSPKGSSTALINSQGFDAGATLTANGNTMYFVSDRNTKNGSDIYVSYKTGKTWGAPIPLSDSINTSGNETTPFITPDGKYLFFSSDGHIGMGGYDIFVSKNLGGINWSKPVNLGPAINSVNNDTHFQYYPELKKAMFASQVISGFKSNIDIFEIDTTDFKLP